MTRSGAAAPAHDPADATASLVWVDARQAIVLRWERGATTVTRRESDVPGHHHSTGHVRHDPSPGSGIAGPPRAAGESHRLEHLARFIDDVASAVPTDGDVMVIGPGTVHERLADRLHVLDVRHGGHRSVEREASEPLTERQLIARLRTLAGSPKPRRIHASPARVTVPARRASGSPARRPGRGFDPGIRRRPEAGFDEQPFGDDEPTEDLEDAGLVDADRVVTAGGAPGGAVVVSGADPGSPRST